MEAKPIAIVKLDHDTWKNNTRNNFTVTKYLEEKLEDYHVLVVPAAYNRPQEQEMVEIDLVSVKDITETDIEELKGLIKYHIKQLQDATTGT